MPTHHHTNLRNGIDAQVHTHLQRIEARAPTADRVVLWIVALGTAALIGLIGVIVLPRSADLAELTPAALSEETT